MIGTPAPASRRGWPRRDAADFPGPGDAKIAFPGSRQGRGPGRSLMTTLASVSCQGWGLGDPANHGKTKYLCFGGIHES